MPAYVDLVNIHIPGDVPKSISPCWKINTMQFRYEVLIAVNVVMLICAFLIFDCLNLRCSHWYNNRSNNTTRNTSSSPDAVSSTPKPPTNPPIQPQYLMRLAQNCFLSSLFSLLSMVWRRRTTFARRRRRSDVFVARTLLLLSSVCDRLSQRALDSRLTGP